MTFILGTKQKMTQVFNEEGTVTPVTVLQAGPVTVTQIKTSDKDGYTALQYGFGTKSPSKVSRAQQGHLKDNGPFQVIKEVRVENKDTEGMKVGDTVDVSAFTVGDVISVSSTSKGKGFQGGVKRYNFSGGRRSHGNKHAEREGGSIGSTGPQRVFKNVKMPGRMGAERVTVKNLVVVGVDKEAQQLLVKGAVPGRKGSIVEMRATLLPQN